MKIRVRGDEANQHRGGCDHVGPYGFGTVSNTQYLSVTILRSFLRRRATLERKVTRVWYKYCVRHKQTLLRESTKGFMAICVLVTEICYIKAKGCDFWETKKNKATKMTNLWLVFISILTQKKKLKLLLKRKFLLLTPNVSAKTQP